MTKSAVLALFALVVAAVIALGGYLMIDAVQSGVDRRTQTIDDLLK